MYKCRKCKKDVKQLDTKFVRCPYCGSRVLYKMRQPIAKDIGTD